jgi:hypothetical protein
MNKLLITISRKPLAQISSFVLIVVAALLTVSALMAQPSDGARPSAKGCKDWPLDKDKAKVEAAFSKVLVDSATDSKLRAQLLDASDCYKNPKSAVQRILDGLPGDKVTIPKEAVIIFYEDDSTELTKSVRPFADNPSNHCLHIFFLPAVGEAAVKTSFSENLMCCYKPWGPPPPPTPR